MGFSRSPLAFDDIKAALDKALEAQKGIRIRCRDRGAAVFLRQRFNSFRKLDRQENARIYDNEHPMFRRSIYDKLVLRIPAKGNAEEEYLYVEKRGIEDFLIEDLTEGD